jgi:PAS domain S-box-containing protein
MPGITTLSDPAELQRCVRDLVALSTLPALWKSYDPQQIADSVAAALVSMLDADFVCVTLPGGRDEPAVEVIRTGRTVARNSFATIVPALRQELCARISEQCFTVADPATEGRLRVSCMPIGFGGEAAVFAGSRDPDFPREVQKLLLGIGANEATVALQRWQAEADQHRFVTLIERSSDFIAFADLEGRPQFINPAGLKLAGLAGMEQASRFHFLDFIAPDERSRIRDEVGLAVMRKGRWVGEIRLRHFETGAEIPVLVDWFRIDNPRTGRPMNTATVGRDLTAQKRAEARLRSLAYMLEQRVCERTGELAEANRRLLGEIVERERSDARVRELQLESFHAARLNAAGQLAATLAHELTQPLTAATNSLNAARRLLARNGNQANAKIAEIMSEASEQTLHAGQVIRRLRDFVARGETEKRIEDLSAMIADASALAMTGVKAIGVQLRFRFDPKVSSAFLDRIQIQQVLINLMRNGLEAMVASRHRELVVATRLLDQDTVEIAVVDSGPGLPDEVADHLFEPFVSTKRNGMGLGLSICRAIVESHGGKLLSSPNPDGGTVFRFTVAAAPNEGELRAG